MAAAAISIAVVAPELPQPDWWGNALIDSPPAESAPQQTPVQKHRIRARFARTDLREMRSRITERIEQSQVYWRYHPMFFRHGYRITTNDPQLVAELWELDRQNERLTPAYRNWNLTEAPPYTLRAVPPGEHRLALFTRPMSQRPNLVRAVLALGTTAGIALMATIIAFIETHERNLTYHNLPTSRTSQ